MWDTKPWTAPRTSFPRPIAAPVSGPCDPPLVCLQINASYIPYIAGAMSQLVQRTTWTAATEDDLQQILANMTQAIEIVGTAVQCSQPPLIPGQPTLSRACNIAGYLANYVIRESMSQGANAVQNSIGVVTFIWGIVRFIPGFAEALPVTWLALNGLIAAINTFGYAIFQTAVNDPTLFPAITCAIYNAISADGQVTNNNFPQIITNINAISFASSDVKTTLIQFIDNLGAGGLEALQTGGPFADYDCTGCGTGPALGPVGPSPFQLNGKSLLQIAIGAADAALTVLFAAPFDTPPLLTAASDNEDVVTSFLNTTATGTTLRITSAVPATATMMANVDWIAQLPGAP